MVLRRIVSYTMSGRTPWEWNIIRIAHNNNTAQSKLKCGDCHTWWSPDGLESSSYACLESAVPQLGKTSTATNIIHQDMLISWSEIGKWAAQTHTTYSGWDNATDNIGKPEHYDESGHRLCWECSMRVQITRIIFHHQSSLSLWMKALLSMTVFGMLKKGFPQNRASNITPWPGFTSNAPSLWRFQHLPARSWRRGGQAQHPERRQSARSCSWWPANTAPQHRQREARESSSHKKHT